LMRGGISSSRRPMTSGTAWLRVALLPADAQPPMRDLFRRYLDSRIEVYRKVPDMEAVKAEQARSAKLQSEIWALAVSSTREAGTAQAPMLLLPALNAMFDITTTRTEAARVHPPLMIFGMLGALTLACSLFAGYDMAIRRRLNVFALRRLRRRLVSDRICDHRSRVPAPWIYPDTRLRPGARRSA